MTNVQQELNAIKKIMEDKNPELLIRVTSQHFGNEELGKLYLLIKQFYVSQGSWIGWGVLRSIVAQKCTTADKSRYLMGLLDQIQERDISGLSDEFLLDELEATSRCRAILDNIKDVALAAEQKDLAAVQGLYRKGYEQAFLAGMDSSCQDANLLTLAGADVTFNWRTTGIPGIDERNGVSTGSLVLICGDSGAGKSTAAHSVACHQYYKYGDGVAYWSWEQGKKELMARIFSHESDVDLGKIIDDKLTPEERLALRKAKLRFLFLVSDEDLKGFVCNIDQTEEEFIKWAAETYEPRPNGFYIYDHGPDFDELMVQMELLRSTKWVKVFVVDYLTLIPPGVSHRGLASWEAYIRMSDTLKNFARRHDVIVIVPLQYDSKEGKIKFSKNILNASDLAIFMAQDKEDKELGAVTWEFGKYRNFKTIPGKPLAPFKMLTAFDRAKFVKIEF